MKRFLNGLSTSVPEMVNLYMMSLQYNQQQQQLQLQERGVDIQERGMVVQESADVRAQELLPSEKLRNEGIGAMYGEQAKQIAQQTIENQRIIDKGIQIEVMQENLVGLLDTINLNKGITPDQRKEVINEFRNTLDKITALGNTPGELTGKYGRQAMGLEATTHIANILFQMTDPKIVKQITDGLESGWGYPETMTEIAKIPGVRSLMQSLAKMERMGKESIKAVGTFVNGIMKERGIELPQMSIVGKELDKDGNETGRPKFYPLSEAERTEAYALHDEARAMILNEYLQVGILECGLDPAEFGSPYFEMAWLPHYPRSNQMNYWAIKDEEERKRKELEQYGAGGKPPPPTTEEKYSPLRVNELGNLIKTGAEEIKKGATTGYKYGGELY